MHMYMYMYMYMYKPHMHVHVHVHVHTIIHVHVYYVYMCGCVISAKLWLRFFQVIVDVYGAFYISNILSTKFKEWQLHVCM